MNGSGEMYSLGMTKLSFTQKTKLWKWQSWALGILKFAFKQYLLQTSDYQWGEEMGEGPVRGLELRDTNDYVKLKVKLLSCVQLFVTPWTVAYQAPPSMKFSRKEYWSGFPFPSPGYLPNPGIESRSLALQADILLSEPPGKPKIHKWLCIK